MLVLNSVLSEATASRWHWCQGVRDTELAHGTHTRRPHTAFVIKKILFYSLFCLYFCGRYKRRGIDEDGNVANYVETEQILSFGDYQMAFTIVRGSVPVYWSQPGYKYRPPPKLDRGDFNAASIQSDFIFNSFDLHFSDEKESQIAFEKHFDAELKLYKSICIINLVEQSGKEKIIFDAYGNHVVKYNNDQLIYVTFDFHDYW